MKEKKKKKSAEPIDTEQMTDAAICENVDATVEDDAAVKYTEQNFISDLIWTEKKYMTALVISAILAAASICVAVMIKVSYGLIGAMATVVVYMGCVGHILYSRLGFAYTSTTGALKITEIYGKKRDELWIPRRLLRLDVCEIGSKACDHSSTEKVRFIHLPKTIKTIGDDAFSGCKNLELICFEGSEEEWNEIEKGSGLDGIKILFCDVVAYPEKPSKKGKGEDEIPAPVMPDGASEEICEKEGKREEE